MKAVDLYARAPESVTNELQDLFGCYYSHISELNCESVDAIRFMGLSSPLIEIRTLKYFNYDSRRFWRLATVWFSGLPVMIIQNAGREGDDHAKRFITDADTYKLMVKHIQSLIPPLEMDISSTPDDVDMPELSVFYGDALDGYFERY